MIINGKTILVTGANRGIGQALVAEALSRGASRVYAGSRQPLTHPDGRVTPLVLDVTSPAQIQAAAEQVGSLDILINNAGIALYDDLSDRGVLEQHLAVNLFGTYGVTRAFLPLLTRSRGAIVNNVSAMAVAPFPLTPAYAISKGAPSSTACRTRRRTSSPIPCRRPSPRAGAAARSRRWNATTRHSPPPRPPRPRPAAKAKAKAKAKAREKERGDQAR
jgi:NAD(P)-dependent dehydrogenase (short-subunit alcohol dehydrogenase family)